MRAAGVEVELVEDDTDAVVVALDRTGWSLGACVGTVEVGLVAGVNVLTTDVGGVNGRRRGAGKGEGGGVGRLLLAEVDSTDSDGCRVILGRCSWIDAGAVVGSLGRERGSG